MQREFLVSCDVGGTNTTVALIERDRNHFHRHASYAYRSQELGSIFPALEASLEKFAAIARPTRCCVSGAGPVSNKVCVPSNVSWRIDGGEIEARFRIPTMVINDFTAVVYALPLLDPENPKQLVPLPHVDGSLPRYREDMFLSVGAGTGLGVGALLKTGKRYVPIPSEGGHADLAPFDTATLGLWQYWLSHYRTAPGAEALVSGPGITRIFEFFAQSGAFANHELRRRIEETEDRLRPSLIASHAAEDEDCRRVMECFIRLYGRVASNTALTFAGKGSLFIGGGIVTKNISLFSQNTLFMEAFENNYHPQLRSLLKTVPVYLTVNYDISVYGAAHAASTQFLDVEKSRTIS